MSHATTDAASDSNAPQQPELLWVELGERRYPIWIGTDVSDKLAEAMAGSASNGRKSVAVIDSNFRKAVAEANAKGGSSGRSLECSLKNANVAVLDITIEGEPAKSLEKLGQIYDAMAAQHVGRDGSLLAIGGGVTGDLAGFAAASYLRGIDFYQVPTTLLAIVDSSVGGKTGINIDAGKNLVGAFWQPKAVFISTACLSTLPPREFAAGIAEVIKYGMLYDADFFAQLEQQAKSGQRLNWNHPELPRVIRRCCEIKAAIVGNDERETKKDGGRALLNLGHTFAHAIENAAGYGTYLHGEAVAIGLMMAARLSEILTERGQPGYAFTAADTARVHALISAYNLPTALNQPLGSSGATGSQVIPPALHLTQLQQAMGRDKKVLAGTIRFVAMEQLGTAATTNGVDPIVIDALWREFGAEG